MGLFDIFKAKPENKGRDNKTFELIYKYREYVACFMRMQHSGNYAPISAYETNSGEVVGYLYLDSDPTYILMAQDVIKKMEEEFEQRLHNKTIKSYTIYYHSKFQNNSDHSVAILDDDLKAISVVYNSVSTGKGATAITYTFEGDTIHYNRMEDFTVEESNSILAAKLVEGKNYFKDRIPITSPSTINSAGITIKKSNRADLSNTWGGVFGFETFRSKNGGDVLQRYFAESFAKPPVKSNNDIHVHELGFGDLIFRSVQAGGLAKTIMPVIKTNYTVDIETREISEWEHIDNLEAMISARGRDTFGVTFFATDYAIHRDTYLTQKNLNIEMSAILYVLDLRGSLEPTKEGEPTYSEDFAGYMPNKDLAVYGCFDFMGILEDVKEVSVLPDGITKAYLLKIRLINQPDRSDFFTIDMYVNLENMRFQTPEKGMKISGMFQLQGQIQQ